MTDPRVELTRLATGVNGDIVVAMLDSLEIVIEAPEPRTHSHADQVALYNLTNQVCRLFAHVQVDIAGDAPCDLGAFGKGSLGDVLEALRRDLAIETTPLTLGQRKRFYLAWGMDPSGEGFSGDATDWTYSAGPRHVPLPDGSRTAPLGAIATTCFMAAQALGHALKPLGVPYLRTDGFVSNLLDYRLQPAPIVETEARLGQLTLCGCGSVGSSSIYCTLLAGVRGGPVDMIDGDAFKPRNKFRYPVLREPITTKKATWLADLARSGGIDATAHFGSIQAYLESLPDIPAHSLAAVSVDTLDGRRDATDILARTTLNVGVLGLKLHAACHGFSEEGCAYCQYVDVEPPLSASAALAEQTGLSVERVVELEISGDVLSEADIAVVAAACKLQDDPPHIGERLADLRRRVYAQAVVPTAEGEVLVAAPFVSTLAGLLLLVETLKDANPELYPYRLDGRYDADMSGEPTGFVTATTRDKSGRCLCYSPHRQLAYRELHPVE
jgi:hypothetical protein